MFSQLSTEGTFVYVAETVEIVLLFQYYFNVANVFFFSPEIISERV